MKLAEFTTRVLLATTNETMKGDHETELVLHLKDEITRAEGHLRYTLITNGRECIGSTTTTDNPALFDRQHPEDHELQELLGNTDKKPAPGMETIIAKCIIPVTYKAGNPNGATYEEQKWGLYCN